MIYKQHFSAIEDPQDPQRATVVQYKSAQSTDDMMETGSTEFMVIHGTILDDTGIDKRIPIQGLNPMNSNSQIEQPA